VGEPGSSELSVTAGETLVVSRKDVGEGWWEGTNSSGRTGLFPAAYVEVCFSRILILYNSVFLSLSIYTLNNHRKSKPRRMSEKMKVNHHQLYHHHHYHHQQTHGKLMINKMNFIHKFPGVTISNRMHIHISRLVL